jgi:hypothetical protein
MEFERYAMDSGALTIRALEGLTIAKIEEFTIAQRATR